MPGKVLSQERVSLSDVEDESSSGSDRSVVVSKEVVGSKGDVKGNKRKSTSGEVANENTPQASKRAKMTASRADHSSSSDSSSDEDEDMPDKHKSKTPIATIESNGLSSPQIASTPYVYNPPEGFVEMRKPNPPSANLNKLFSSANLEGKQLWHITLPSDVPVSTLKDIDVGKARSGATILSHGGISYGFRIEANSMDDRKGARLLLSNNGGLGYSSAPQPFDSKLILQQSQHPATSYKSSSSATGVDGAAQPNFPTVKGVRQQPANLRARYFPSGFEDNISTASQTNGSSANQKDSASKSDSSSGSETSEEESDEEL
jgi:hypothetical protein